MNSGAEKSGMEVELKSVGVAQMTVFRQLISHDNWFCRFCEMCRDQVLISFLDWGRRQKR